MMLCFLRGRRGPLPTPSPKVSPSSPTNPLSLCPAGEKTEESIKLALLSATLLFFAMVDGFNAIRAQDRFGSDYSDTKKNTKDANARANALAALIFIQFVISLAQVWVASTRLRLAKKADEPAKTETEGSFEGEVASKEPSADEPAPKSESGCVAS